MDGWSGDSQEKFVRVLLDFWPHDLRDPATKELRAETVRTIVSSVERYSAELVIQAVREIKSAEDKPRLPTIAAILDRTRSLNRQAQEFAKKKHDLDIGVTLTPQDFAGEDPHGWWAERENSEVPRKNDKRFKRESEWYRWVRVGLMEGRWDRLNCM